MHSHDLEATGKRAEAFLRTVGRLGDLMGSAPDREALTATVLPVVDQGLTLAEEVLVEGRPDLGLKLTAKLKALRLLRPGLDTLRARCFLALSRPDDAREAFKEELRYFPENPAARAGLAGLDTAPPAARDDRLPGFNRLLPLVRPYTMLSVERLRSLFELALIACREDLPGAFVECGVAAGGSSALLAWVLKNHSRRRRHLYSFDSFEGMPAPGVNDRHAGQAAEETGWGTGTCASPLESLQRAVAQVGAEGLVVPVKGYFNSTLPRLAPVMGPIALLHMDGDWYESTRDILVNLWDRVLPGGFIQIDDFGFWEGCRKAVEEFAAERRLQLAVERIDSTGVRLRKP